MADDGRVVGQADVSRVVLVVLAARCGGLVAHDEGTLDVDAHIAGVQDGVMNVGLGSGASRARGHAVQRCILRWFRRSSSSSGIARRGARMSARWRHGFAGAWLQPRPLCGTTM